MKITYLGHSAFEIETNDKTILIDPFLVKVQDYKPYNLSDIFVTHGHADHLGSAIELSKSQKAPVNAIFELANYCAKKGAYTKDFGLGSWQKYSWGRAIFVPAFHTSSAPDGSYAGCPCGIVFEIEGKKLYHAGDTNLNSEMKLIGELYSPEISMLPVGGKYTMDIEHALIASRWLNTKYVIPMHYNTFDAIQVDIKEFVYGANSFEKIPMALKVGECFQI